MSALLIGSLGLLGCASSDEVATTARYVSAGDLMSPASFGSATQTNTLRMADPNFYGLELAQRFASEVNSVVNFASNSTALDDQAKSILNQQVHWISQFPEVRFRVYGHADATGSAKQNKSLGQRRAQAVVNYLVRNGISKSRIHAVTSRGDTQPLIVTLDDEPLNRRAVTEVTGFVGSHPMVMNGEYGMIVYRQYTGTTSSAK